MFLSDLFDHLDLLNLSNDLELLSLSNLLEWVLSHLLDFKLVEIIVALNFLFPAIVIFL